MPTYTITVELEVELDYTLHPAWSGIRDRGGMQLEPDEPAHVIVNSARIVGGPEIDIDLIPRLDDIEADIYQSECDAREAAAEDYYEARREERRERLYAEGSL